MKEKYLKSLDELKAVDDKYLPLLVFSTNFKGILSYLIRLRTSAIYSHFMWMHRPDFFASQNWVFGEIPTKKHVNSKLKLVYNTVWTQDQRTSLIMRIKKEIDRPKWRTRYDWINLIGQLTGLKFIQNPYTKICSETAGFLKDCDPSYDFYNPTPDDINCWANESPNYAVYARYTPD